MNTIEQVEADVEALKAILVALIELLSTDQKKALQTLVLATIESHTAVLQYTAMTDEQIEKMRRALRLLAGLAPQESR